MENLTLVEKEFSTCAFSGHRELGSDFNENKLTEKIEFLIKKGVKTFYNGGAVGFDLISAEIVLKLKEKYDIKLVICVPFYGQEKWYLEKDKERYNRVLNMADEVVRLSDNYYKGCLLRRNDYMIERADCMLVYLKKDVGGTAYTVRKFRAKKGEYIIYL